MRYSQTDPDYERIATLDIETTHYDPTEGETVSVGLGFHDLGTQADEATYELYHRNGGNDEGEVIAEALGRLDEYDADGLVTYNGRSFDLRFLRKRRQALGFDPIEPSIDTPQAHIDLCELRKREAPPNKKWPSLEECLESYGLDVPVTMWNGSPVTNTRFGEELGPTYLKCVENGDDGQRERLTDVIDHYLTTDLEANIALYYADIGEQFEPAYLGSPGEF